MKNLFILGCLVLFSLGCVSSKKLTKQAQALEKEGNYKDAVNLYSQAYIKKDNNKLARKGLQRTGQIVLDDLLAEFWKNYNLESYAVAIKAYKQAVQFEKNISQQRIRLEWPSHYNGYYEESIEKYLQQLYLEAAKAIDARNYAKAQKNIAEIQSYSSDYEGIPALKQAIELDPIYQQALDALNANQPGVAIGHLQKVADKNPNYRETAMLMQQLRNQYTMRIALLPIQNQTNYKNLPSEFSTQIITQILQLKNPLIQLIDRENMETLLAEQKLGMSGLFDEKSAAQAGKLLGSNVVLVGSITGYEYTEAAPTKEYKQAFIREQVYYRDFYTGAQMSNFQFRETNYTEWKEEQKLTITFKFRLVAAETGQIIASDVVTRSVINQIRYADYAGQLQDLYPTTGQISQGDLKKWRSRFSVNHTKKSNIELEQTVEEEIARIVAASIQQNGFTNR